MEKRSNPRRPISTSIVCNRFKSFSGDDAINGKMKNCCLDGFHAELKIPFKPGTMLIVRLAAWPGRYTIDDGFRSQALAEVRWSKTKTSEGDVCYATGLKYIVSY